MRIFSHGYGQLHFSMKVSWLPKDNWIRSKKKRESEIMTSTQPWRRLAFRLNLGGIKAGPVSISGQDALVQGEEYISLFSVQSV